MVAKLFTGRCCEFLTLIYQTYIRPCLKYASATWSPINGGTSDQLEKIQQHFMRRLFGNQPPAYEDRLNILGLQSLSVRRKVTDFVLTFQLLHILVDFDPQSVGVSSFTANTRSRGVNLKVNRATSHRVAGTFSHCIAGLWNSLSLNVKHASTTLPVLKKRLWTYFGTDTKF